MTPAGIIREARAEGLTLALSPAGTIKAVGEQTTVNRWLPVIREHKTALLEHLRAANEPTLPAELDRLIRKAAAFHGFTVDELEEALAVASRDVDNALVSFRLLAAGVDAFMDIDREAFEERAAIREYDGGYSRDDAELLAAWKVTQALFARLTAREWLARYAPERLPEGDAPENYPVAQIPPGNTFWMERARRGGRR